MLKLKKIKPLFTAVVTTAERFEEDELSGGVIIQSKGEMRPLQKVISVGDCVRNIKVGDIVMVNPTRYTKVKQEMKNSIKETMTQVHEAKVTYDIPVIQLDGVDHLYLQDRDIDFVVEDYEEVESSNIVLPEKKIIV